MTEDQLAAIEARATAATLGPWYWEAEGEPGSDQPQPYQPRAQMGAHGRDRVAWCELVAGEGWIFAPDTVDVTIPKKFRDPGMPATGPIDVVVIERGDAEFIAHAREDIPALLAEVRRLRALVPAEFTFDGIVIAETAPDFMQVGASYVGALVKPEGAS